VAVKRSLSASRMLGVFEEIVRSQPVGVSALARALDADKSAVQRDLMTLADAGWIRPTPGTKAQWELTPHILTLAQVPHSNDSLRQIAKPAMERLRTQTGETVYLTVPHEDHFVIIEALESPHMLRMVSPVGLEIPVEGSATARAIFAHVPDKAELAGDRENTLRQGYAVNDGDIVAGSVTMASAILGSDRAPVGAIVVTGPADRITPDRRDEIGSALNDAAQFLSAV